MSKYQSYSCSNLLEYLDNWYANDTDRTNYAKYLLTMQETNTINKLINIYDKVLWKFILQYNGFGKADLVSDTWYNINDLSDDTKVYWKSLNVFLNENIKRLFDSQDYTDKLSLECITNLREASNCDGIRKEILSKSSENVTSIQEKVLSSLSVVNNAPKYISPYNLDTNGCLDYKSKYINNIKYLISLGFIKSIKDSSFELKTNINYIPNTKTLIKIIICCIAIVPIVILLTKYLFIGIFAILCVLALLKML